MLTFPEDIGITAGILTGDDDITAAFAAQIPNSLHVSTSTLMDLMRPNASGVSCTIGTIPDDPTEYRIHQEALEYCSTIAGIISHPI